MLAYALSDGGTDWEIWRFRRVDDGTDLPDELRFTKFWELSWSRDGRGVWYSRYPQRAAGAAGAAEGRGDDLGQPVVNFHRLGEPQSADTVVYQVKDDTSRTPSARVTDDGRWLVVTLFDGYEANGIDLVDLRRPGAPPRRLFGAWDALYTVIGSEGDTFFVQTTRAAPRGRVIAVDARRPEPRHWREARAAVRRRARRRPAWSAAACSSSYVRDARMASRACSRWTAARRRGAAARARHGRGLRRPRRTIRDVLLLHRLPRPGARAALRRRDATSRPVPHAATSPPTLRAT